MRVNARRKQSERITEFCEVRAEGLSEVLLLQVCMLSRSTKQAVTLEDMSKLAQDAMLPALFDQIVSILHCFTQLCC